MIIRQAFQWALRFHISSIAISSFLILIFLFGLPLTLCKAALYEPPGYWAKTFGGDGSDDPHLVIQTSDGGFLVGGLTSSFGEGGDDMWIIKLTKNGGIQWEKAYGRDGDDSLSSAEQTSDGGYIMTGYTGFATAAGADWWVLKLDDQGNIEWQYRYGGSNYDVSIVIHQTRDGGYIVGGVTRSFGDALGDLLVVKLNPDGGIEWQKKYGQDGLERRVEDIPQTTDGGYIMASTVSWPAEPYGAILILRLDETGNIEWQKLLREDETHLDGEGIQQTNDGGYVLLGERSVPDPDDGWKQSLWVVKLTESGDIDWEYSYGTEEEIDIESIMQTRDNGYVIGGAITLPVGIESDAWIIKLGSSGEIEWEKVYGGSGNDQIGSLVQVSDGGYVAAAKTFSFGVVEKDFLVLKVDDEGKLGCCLPGFRYADHNATFAETHAETVATTLTADVIEVDRAETNAVVTNTDATIKELCFIRLYLRQGIVQCLSIAPWIKLMIVAVFLGGASILGFITFRVIRNRQSRETR